MGYPDHLIEFEDLYISYLMQKHKGINGYM